MAEDISRQEKRKMLQERYGSAFAPPLKTGNKGGRPKGSKNKKSGTITTEDYKGKDANEV